MVPAGWLLRHVHRHRETIDRPAGALLTISAWAMTSWSLDGWRPTGAPGDHGGMTRAPGAARSSLDDPHLLRALHGQGQQRALPVEPRQGADRACRSPSTCRPRPGYDPDHVLAKGEVGKVGVPVVHLGPHGRAARRHPAGRDEHVDDDQRAGRVAARALRRQRRAPGRAEPGPAGHHPERHRQGVPVPRHLHLPAAAVPPADRRHDRLLRGVGAAVEPDERVQLPPAGGGRDAGAGARLQPGHRDRRARRGAGVRARSTRTGSRRCSRRSASS